MREVRHALVQRGQVSQTVVPQLVMPGKFLSDSHPVDPLAALKQVDHAREDTSVPSSAKSLALRSTSANLASFRRMEPRTNLSASRLAGKPLSIAKSAGSAIGCTLGFPDARLVRPRRGLESVLIGSPCRCQES